MSDLVNIEDAKVLKRMGLPLNMPVQHRQFAREGTKHYTALWSDLTAFCNAMYDYRDNSTEKNFKGWKRVLGKMRRRAKELLAHADRLEDRHEAACLHAFIERKVAPFYDGWCEVFEALESGEPVTIRPINEWEWNPLQGAAL
jgi:hypothetical protein